MDYKELFKKYWFVGIVAIALLVFVGMYAADTYKNKETTVPSKQIDGKYVVYSVDDENVMADDFYESLFTENGLNSAFIAYQRAILDNAYKTTDNMNSIATNYAAYMYQQYGDEFIKSQLQAMGYVNGSDDLIQYYIDSQKRDLLVSDYLKVNFDEMVKPFAEENNARIIYHILVKVADITSSTDENGNTVYTANPTEEEKAKLDAALKALETKTFEEVASEYSDDSSSTYGGYIGCVSNVNSNNYYPIFSSTSLALNEDEVSEPVVSSAGYHIIWNAGSTKDILLGDTEFLSEVENNNPTIGIKAVMDKASELGFEIVDQNLKDMVQAQLDAGEAE